MYCVLLGGIIGFILYLQNKEEKREVQPKVEVNETETIDEFTIENPEFEMDD